MITPVDNEAVARELEALLDEEISLLDLRRSQLAELSKVILARDDNRMEHLLEEIERTQHIQAATDSRLNALRSALAGAWNCAPGEVRLSRVIAESPGQTRIALEHRRQQIVAMTQALRKQHLETAVLLSECAKVNRRLLEGLLPRSQEVTTYGAEGSRAWRPDTGLTDQEL
jgi:flagellar biosynthesis/type III secretory pathway chaperone